MTTTRLSNAALATSLTTARRFAYDRTRIGTGILHFGPGAFHRVHQAWYANRLLESDPRWGIEAVSLHGRAVRDALLPQDGLYTIAVQDEVPGLEVVGALRSVHVAPDDPQAVIERFADPRLQVVTLTVTEKGYCLAGDGTLDLSHPDVRVDLASPASPGSVLGYLVAGLGRRRSLGLPAPAILSCDNLTGNGRRLRRAAVALAAARDRALADWIDGEVAFPCTMVDSICPATTDALRADVARRLGLVDAWPVQRESFVQWVIEDLPMPRGPAWVDVGVTLTGDVGAFEQAKLRILNGAHSTLAYLGLRAGCRTVADAMRHADLVGFVRSMLRESVLPTLVTRPGLDLDAYVETVLRRFRNPAIEHELAQIAWDGSQKLRFRILGTVRDALAAGRDVDRLCVPLAAWMRFARGKTTAASPIVDPLAARLDRLGRDWQDDARIDVARFLELDEVFGDDLPVDSRFRNALERAYARVRDWPGQPLGPVT